MHVSLLVASEVIAMRQPGLVFSLGSMIISLMLATNIAVILIDAEMYQVTSPASSSHDNVPEPLMTYRWLDNCPAKDGVPTKQCNSRTGMIPNGSRCYIQWVKDAIFQQNN